MTAIKTIGVASFGGRTSKKNIMHKAKLPIPTFCGTCGSESTMYPGALKIQSFESRKDLNFIELTGECTKCSSSITVTQSYKANE